MKFIKSIALFSLLITGSVTASSVLTDSQLVSSTLTAPALSHSRETIGWHLIEDGALYIDARTAQGYAAGHRKGGINITSVEH